MPSFAHLPIKHGSLGVEKEIGNEILPDLDARPSDAWVESARVSRPLSPGPRSVIPALSGHAPTRLHGRYLLLARMAWAAVAMLTVVCIVVSIPVEFAQLQKVCTTSACRLAALTPANASELGEMGLSAGFYAGYLIAVDLLVAATSFVVGVLVFWRKSDERIALFVALALVTSGSQPFIGNLDAVISAYPALWWSLALVTFMGNILPVLFFFVFPDGRFVPRWTWMVAILLVVLGVCFHFFPDSSVSRWLSSPPGLVLSVCFVATAVLAQLYRYRRVSGPVQRQQSKWVVFGATTAMVVSQGVTIAFTLQGRAHIILTLIAYTVVYASLLLIPLSIGVAILRHNLWDIDLVINRTLVYSALTASVVLLYVLVVGGLGALLQLRGNLIISLLATGLAAVLFAPLRDRLQRGVNGLMYGERDDPYGVLSRLGSRLESTLTHDAVLPAVAKTVKEALKLPYVAIQLRQEEGFETAAAVGDPVDQPLDVPLVYGGETVGRLILGPRAGDETFGPADRRLLEDLTHLIGVAAHAVQLTDEALRLSADLQRSRERLVTAREEERRRLRRDLHDGLGPQLAGLTMTAEAARDLVSTDPERAKDLLGDLMERAQAAVSDVRHLVYALRPPALDALGLFGALRAHADHHNDGGVRVSVEAPEHLPPLPAAVEVAAYRIALEAIINAERHAGARSCVVRVALDETAGALLVEVVDDGRGIGEERGTGVGLSSMRERAAELGGWCTVEAVGSGGTRVRASLPCGRDSGTEDDMAKPEAQEEE
jgi:signal transduction histidine kinase